MHCPPAPSRSRPRPRRGARRCVSPSGDGPGPWGSSVPLTALALPAGTTIVLAANSSAAPSAPLSSTWYASAPYLMPEDNSPPDVSTVMDATGQKAFQLAIILAPNGGGCSPTWGG